MPRTHRLDVSHRGACALHALAEHQLTTKSAPQFFISPLISPDGIARERQAVDSEHSKNLQSDGWRQQQLWKALANPEHRCARMHHAASVQLPTHVPWWRQSVVAMYRAQRRY
jgi:hypothetical protein